MDQGRVFADTLLRLRHRHGDSWQEMEDITHRRGSGGRDPEREWANHRVFRCAACAEEIMVEEPAGPGAGHSS